MPSDTEALIREVLAAQADRAPHRATVLAGLRWTRQRRSYRRVAMVAAGITVVLAMIGVPLGLHLTTGHVTAASQPVLPAQQPDIPIPYHVTWLPAGFVSSARGADSRSVTQRWEPSGIDRQRDPNFDNIKMPLATTPFIELGYERAGVLNSGNEATKVDINGAAGYLDVPLAGNPRSLTWEPRPDVVLYVSAWNVPDLTSVVLRVARSVVAGSTDVVPQPMTLGWLPPGFYDAEAMVVHGTSPNDWVVIRALENDSSGPVVTVNIAWSSTKSGAYSYHPSPNDPRPSSMQTSLDGGFLTVSSFGADPGQIQRIAANVVIFQHVDLAWLGR